MTDATKCKAAQPAAVVYPCGGRAGLPACTWHTCGSLMPTLSVSGSAYEGLNDGYVQTGQMYNEEPVWIGKQKRYVAYFCKTTGAWVFNSDDGYQMEMEMNECRGHFIRSPSGQNQLHTGGSWKIVDATVTCTTSALAGTFFISLPRFRLSHCVRTLVCATGLCTASYIDIYIFIVYR